jgi:HEPN domain-containing protein
MNAPIWGNFVRYADGDVLAFAWLFQGGLHPAAYYHATQALEKYLKGLALSIIDPGGRTHPFPKNERWLQTHDLARLAERSSKQFTYYGGAQVRAALKRFSEFDQLARYPWVQQNLGNGFTSADVPVICELLLHLRTDIPIANDDYPLGMLIRGHHHQHPESAVNPNLAAMQAPAVAAARRIIPQIEQMVRR